MLVPEKILRTLKAPPNRPLLMTQINSPRFVALHPRACAGDTVSLSAAAFRALDLQTCAAPAVEIHRPLTHAACDEAEKLQRGEVRALPFDPRPSWIDAPDAEILPRMMDAVMNGTTAHLETPRGLLLGGTGSLSRVAIDNTGQRVKDEAVEPQYEEKYELVSVPAEPAVAEQSEEQQIKSVLERYTRTACVFKPDWTTAPPAQ